MVEGRTQGLVNAVKEMVVREKGLVVGGGLWGEEGGGGSWRGGGGVGCQ